MPEDIGKFVSYLRVSTERQGRSGLGLEAQREAVEDYLNGGDWQLLEEYVEVESGKRDDRRELAKALQQCQLTGATLVIAKLDRLSRDAHFLLGLQKSAVRFVCADMPEANEVTIGLFAVMAQHERKMISERTRAALQAAKARGVKLGNPQGARALLAWQAKHGRSRVIDGIKAAADRRAEKYRGTIGEIMASGVRSQAGIARELNSRKIVTARDRHWHASQVGRLLDRLGL